MKRLAIVRWQPPPDLQHEWFRNRPRNFLEIRAKISHRCPGFILDAIFFQSAMFRGRANSGEQGHIESFLGLRGLDTRIKR